MKSQSFLFMFMLARFNLKRGLAWVGLAGMIFLQSAPIAMAAGTINMISPTQNQVVTTTTPVITFTATSASNADINNYSITVNDTTGNALPAQTGAQYTCSGLSLPSGSTINFQINQAADPGCTYGMVNTVLTDGYGYYVQISITDATLDTGVATYGNFAPPTAYFTVSLPAAAPEFSTWIQLLTIALGMGLMYKFRPAFGGTLA